MTVVLSAITNICKYLHKIRPHIWTLLSYFENFASIFDAMIDANKKKVCITLNPLFPFSASRFYEMFDIGSNSKCSFMNFFECLVDILKGIWNYKECRISTYIRGLTNFRDYSGVWPKAKLRQPTGQRQENFNFSCCLLKF